MSKIRLDDLLGRKVRDREGKVQGRLYEIRVEEQGDDLAIVEYHIGTHAMLERIGLSLLKLVGLHRHEPRTIPWDRLDISDPDNPILLSD